MDTFVLVVATAIIFAQSCTAVCCSNFNGFCIINAIECTPNCGDGISYCDPAVEACLDDNLGGCTPIVWATEISFDILFTSTEYYSTTQVYGSTEVEWQYVTAQEDVDSEVTITDYATYSTTTTVPGPTVTETVEERQRLRKRDVTQTTTISDSNYCNSVDIPECTTTVQLVWTDVLTTTRTDISTLGVTNVNVITAYVTDWYTSIYTATDDEVTVTVTAGDSNPPASSSPQDEQSSSPPQDEQTRLPAEETPNDSDTSETGASPPTATGNDLDQGAGSITQGFSTVIVPTRPADNAGDSSALAVLQSAVPLTAQNNPAGACFLFTQYSSAFTTPPWYTGLPTNAQSYFSSVNAENTAACAPQQTQDNGGSGLSPGAKGGIAAGSILGAVMLGALAFFLIKYGPFHHSGPTGAEKDPSNYSSPMQSAPQAQWPGTDPSQSAPAQSQPSQPANHGTSTGPSSQPPGWSGTSVDPAPGNWSGVTGDPSSGWTGVPGDPTSAGWNGVTGPPQGAPPAGEGPDAELFLMAGAGRRRNSDDDDVSRASRQYPPSQPPSMSLSPVHSHFSIPRREVPSRVNSDQLVGPFAHPARSYSGTNATELSHGGAYRGQEIRGNQRYEAPSPTGLYVGHEIYGQERYEAPPQGARYPGHEIYSHERYEAPGSYNY